MPTKKQTNKRRVAAARQEERRQQTVDKKARRRQLLVGGVVGFMALALIAPLTAGLIGTTSSDDPVVTVPPTTEPVPLDLPWVSTEDAGASISGPTPCPAADGSAERTTEFDQAPTVCIDSGDSFDLDFVTPAGSFTLPVDASLDLDAANLAVVLSLYKAYERTPVTAVGSGFLTVGSFGDPGFTIPATPPGGPVEELYPVGSVVVIADVDNTLSGSLTVVMDEIGSTLMQDRPSHAVIGFIDDLTEIRAVYDAPESADTVLIDSVAVTATG